METKSRYEVIADLEAKKRDLIREKNNFDEETKGKEKSLRDLERALADNTLVLTRKIEDAKDDLDNFKTTVKEKKGTVDELIKSLDDSLARFGKLLSTKKE